MREADQLEAENAQVMAALNEREAAIAKRDAGSVALNEDAAKLKKAYEDKVASIKMFATQVG